MGIETELLDRAERVLEDGLTRHLGRPAGIVDMAAKSLDTYSCHPIDRLRVRLSDGDELTVIFKRLRPGSGKAIHREVLTYRRLLAGSRFGAPMLYASACDDAAQRYWLFLEDVGKRRLDWHGIHRWLAAFQWLGGMHAEYRAREAELSRLGCLAHHDPAFYQGLADAALETIRLRGEPSAGVRLRRLLERRFPATVDHLAAQPRTLIHGDLTGHNLAVQAEARIRPLDWEWAAVGVAAWDVGKLAAGWGKDKPRLIGAYLDEYERRSGITVDRDAFAATLAHCDVLRTLWYLRWWIEGCADPAFVGRLLDKLEALWHRLARA